MNDKNLKCKDCGADFVFTVEEQEFYAQKGFQNEPQRCKQCRIARKQNDRDNRRGGGAKEMHDVICATCGKETQVPFKPRSDKPVYCSDCFKK